MNGETIDLDESIQLSIDKKTVWIHSPNDGSTVGRFSKIFGMDVHTTVSEQLDGAGQCLCCTHEPPTVKEWEHFVHMMHEHHQIFVPLDLIDFRE